MVPVNEIKLSSPWSLHGPKDAETEKTKKQVNVIKIEEKENFTQNLIRGPLVSLNLI